MLVPESVNKLFYMVKGLCLEDKEIILHYLVGPNDAISVQFSHSVVSNSLWPLVLQQARPPCPSPTPGAYSNSHPPRQWWRPTISSSVVPFSSHLQSFPASGSFPMSHFFTSDGQSIGVSASALPMNIQDWFPLEWIGSLFSPHPTRLGHHRAPHWTPCSIQ